MSRDAVCCVVCGTIMTFDEENEWLEGTGN